MGQFCSSFCLCLLLSLHSLQSNHVHSLAFSYSDHIPLFFSSPDHSFSSRLNSSPKVPTGHVHLNVRQRPQTQCLKLKVPPFPSNWSLSLLSSFINGTIIQLVNKAPNLRVIIASFLPLITHIQSIIKSYHVHFLNISPACFLLSRPIFYFPSFLPSFSGH